MWHYRCRRRWGWSWGTRRGGLLRRRRDRSISPLRCGRGDRRSGSARGSKTLGAQPHVGFESLLPMVSRGALECLDLARQVHPSHRRLHGSARRIPTDQHVIDPAIRSQPTSVQLPAVRPAKSFVSDRSFLRRHKPGSALDCADGNVPGREQIDDRIPGPTRRGPYGRGITRCRRQRGFIRAASEA